MLSGMKSRIHLGIFAAPSLLIVVLGVVLGAACGGADQNMPASMPASIPALPKPVNESMSRPPEAPQMAAAKLESKSGSTVTGKVGFMETPAGLEVTVEISGAKPGKHGVHLHETGDCSAPDAKSAGGHFNPAGSTHGGPDAEPRHGGDLGNITAGADGKGMLTIVVHGVGIAGGATSVLGKSVVIHDGEDDLKSQPAGNSGSRVACGVIEGVTRLPGADAR
jgi:Cu-Zn family superoxide dismutase